jgi:hypothetical protein
MRGAKTVSYSKLVHNKQFNILPSRSHDSWKARRNRHAQNKFMDPPEKLSAEVYYLLEIMRQKPTPISIIDILIWPSTK